jgi:pyruvate formate lyase activating enzyme
MDIAGLVKSSLVDFPGLIACVLFVPNCNYDCFYCHNRSLIDGSHVLMDKDDIISFLKKRVGLLDGVVISGGEPTLQTDLLAFAKEIKKLNFKLKLDSNGSNPQMINKAINSNVFDYYAIDYKAPTAKYMQICNGSAGPVYQSINLLLDAEIDFEARTTLIPQLSKDDLVTMAKELPLLPHYSINQYVPPKTYLAQDKQKVEMKPYTKNEIDNILELIKPYQPNAKVWL